MEIKVHDYWKDSDKYKPIEVMPTVGELVKNDNRVKFEFFRSGNFYYTVTIPQHVYEFPVPVEDIGNATIHSYDKAITFMRWIRKAIEDKTIQEKVIRYA
jgi:hypothetical protein